MRTMIAPLYLLETDDFCLLEDLDRPVCRGYLRSQCLLPTAAASQHSYVVRRAPLTRTLCVAKRTRPNEPVPSVTPMSNCEPSSAVWNLVVVLAAGADTAGAAIAAYSNKVSLVPLSRSLARSQSRSPRLRAATAPCVLAGEGVAAGECRTEASVSRNERPDAGEEPRTRSRLAAKVAGPSYSRRPLW